jgi:hypothetical protein
MLMLVLKKEIELARGPPHWKTELLVRVVFETEVAYFDKAVAHLLSLETANLGIELVLSVGFAEVVTGGYRTMIVEVRLLVPQQEADSC